MRVSFFFYFLDDWETLLRDGGDARFYDVDSASLARNCVYHGRVTERVNLDISKYGVAPRFAACNERPASGDLRQIPPRGDSRAVSEEIPALQKWSARARLTTKPHRQLAYILADILPPLPRERSNNALARVHMYTRVHVTARMYTRCRVYVRVAGADIFHFRHRSQTTWVSI